MVRRLALLFSSAIAIRLAAQRNHPDYDEVDPWVGFEQPETGPDSSAVAGFLASLGAALITAYRSDDARLRYAMVRALADIDDHRGTATLTLARQDSDRIVRHAAAEARRDPHDDD